MIKADLHIHTNFSYDAISSPEEVVDTAILRGIGCIAITDHGEIKGAIKAMKYAFDKDILVLPGIEVLSNSGDVLGINVKKIIPNGLSIQETIKEIRKQGGIAVVPHPFGKPLIGFWEGKERLKLVDMDAVETFNASLIFKSGNRKALDFSKENSVASTGGSDSHRALFVGRGYIEIASAVRSEKDLIGGILEKKGRIGGRGLSWLELLKNGANSGIQDVVRYYRLKRRTIKKNGFN